MDPAVRKRLLAIVESYLSQSRGCHGLDHTFRVRDMALILANAYPDVDAELLETAAFLHDIGRGIPAKRPHGELSAEQAPEHLRELGYPDSSIDFIVRAIREHPYSSGNTPSSMVGKILQDADRLDALGAVGIARVFTEGAGRNLYDPGDPLARNRALDDGKFTIDHFYRKILNLPETLHTPEARIIAEERTAFIKTFLSQFSREIGAA